MTALKDYDRLEASGLWRASPEAQRRDVIVSFGDATLVITDMKDQALAHWSLAAVARANPGQDPAVYHPDGDPDETLELGPGEETMTEAIEKVRAAIERRRPRPGRLRLAAFVTITAAVVALAVFWLPDAMRRHTVSVVPQVKRAEIGAALASRITRVTGLPCTAPRGAAALNRLAARIAGPQAATPAPAQIVPGGVRDAVHLPGGLIVLNRALVEDHEDPAVVAGYMLAEAARAEAVDPLEALLRASGLPASFRLLTTGRLRPATLDSYAETLLTAAPVPVPPIDLLNRFEATGVPSSPYAYALDVSGETTLGLIEADPFAASPPPPLLNDADWLSLQAICEA